MPQLPLNGLGLILPGSAESLSPLPPATSGAGQAITNALNAFGAAVWRQWTVHLNDAAIRAIPGGGVRTVIGTLGPFAGSVIIPVELFRLSFNVVAYLTPGATTPGFYYPNSDLPLTAAQTFTNHDNMAANKYGWRSNQLLVPANLGSTSFTAPQIAEGQAVELAVVNAGAAWTVGNAANFITYAITYLLYNPTTRTFV